jgi:8-oxo-dGTP pyrophosphatase MutT (NUDIX family)
MIKIYVNETPIILATSEEAKAFSPSKTVIKSRYQGKHKYLYHFIDNLEKGKKVDAMVIHSNQFDVLKSHFWDVMKVKEAGGGVVFNDKKELLLISRGGYWDMAKGHIEAGETPEMAAVREVEEETGLKNIELGDFFHTTYHVFRNKKDKRVLKVSHWFKMISNDTNFTPQTEENVEKVAWISPEKARELRPIYRNILDLIEMVE